jgi:hypothetical protein
MEDAARDIAERPVRLAPWAGRVGALGGSYLLEGRLADATRIAGEELAAARQRGAREVPARLLRLLGDIAAHPDRFQASTAEAHYRQALGLAEALGLCPLMAHCHLGIGVLYARAGTREQARGHLATAVAILGEMQMRHWRKQSEMAITELA